MWDELHNPEGYVKLDDGSLVDRDVLGIIEQVHAYDPNLKVQYLERAAALGDAPWRIIERCKDGEWRVIFYAWQMDARVLDRIRAADCHMVDVLGGVESNNASLRKAEGRRFQERMEEAKDIVKHIIDSPKGRYSFKNDDGQLVTVDDDPKPSWKIEEK
jgi:hypothetical protein